MNWNNKWSLVLGGGAARGLTYLGVYKWLEEHNYYPSEIVGNSIGAIIGACMSLGMTYEELYNFASDVHWKKLLDFNFRWGVLGGNKVDKILNIIFGQKTFEDCIISFKTVSVDLNTCNKIIFDKGSIKDAVRSSMSIPLLFKPFVLEEKILVDGGVVCNLPIEDSSLKNILALSSLPLIKEHMKIYKEKNGQKKSKGFWGLNSQIAYRVFLSILYSNEEKSLLLGKIQNKNITILRPTPNKFKHYEFHKLDEMVDVGYKYIVDNFGK